jgi:hypothetical protein
VGPHLRKSCTLLRQCLLCDGSSRGGQKHPNSRLDERSQWS